MYDTAEYATLARDAEEKGVLDERAGTLRSPEMGNESAQNECRIAKHRHETFLSA
ncbi:hypothetical protein [Haloferax sp. Q22]|uniref:hypothetical protein n=1 Tax=Haloferax sp. (strain Q22) TaxID=1526048 RepID=UPI0012F71870|nr:hypothetical protein [Haloferax sp. Q22]